VKLFNRLDTDKSNSLDLKELTSFLNHIKEVNQKQISNIDTTIIAELNVKIDRLFRKVDSDSSGFIEEKELENLIKPIK
jgi:hypothetical protein